MSDPVHFLNETKLALPNHLVAKLIADAHYVVVTRGELDIDFVSYDLKQEGDRIKTVLNITIHTPSQNDDTTIISTPLTIENPTFKFDIEANNVFAEVVAEEAEFSGSYVFKFYQEQKLTFDSFRSCIAN